jgi:hypothetical protein
MAACCSRSRFGSRLMLLTDSQCSASRRARSPMTRTSESVPPVFPIAPTAGRRSPKSACRTSANWVISGRAPRMPMVGTPDLEIVQHPSPSNTPSQNIGSTAASALAVMIKDFRGKTPCLARSAAICGEETSATAPAPPLFKRNGRPGDPTNSRNRRRSGARDVRTPRLRRGNPSRTACRQTADGLRPMEAPISRTVTPSCHSLIRTRSVAADTHTCSHAGQMDGQPTERAGASPQRFSRR